MKDTGNDAVSNVQKLLEDNKRRYQESVEKYGKKDPLPTCDACGGYAHVASKYLCRKHSNEWGGQMLCNYCLANALGCDDADIKRMYEEEKASD